MRWLTMLTAAIALIGLPLTGSAQEHSTGHAGAPPRDGEAPVARADHATGGHGIASMSAISCPMMAQPGMGMAPLHRMSAGRSEHSGMGRGMSW